MSGWAESVQVRSDVGCRIPPVTIKPKNQKPAAQNHETRYLHGTRKHIVAPAHLSDSAPRRAGPQVGRADGRTGRSRPVKVSQTKKAGGGSRTARFKVFQRYSKILKDKNESDNSKPCPWD